MTENTPQENPSADSGIEQKQADSTTQTEAQDNQSHTGRKWGVGILILLGVFLLTFANIAFWAWFTLLNTNGWVAAVGPLNQDPAVAGMISQNVVSDLFEGADIEATAAEALPPKLQPLAGPLVVGLEQVADQAVKCTDRQRWF